MLCLMQSDGLMQDEILRAQKIGIAEAYRHSQCSNLELEPIFPRLEETVRGEDICYWMEF